MWRSCWNLTQNSILYVYSRMPNLSVIGGSGVCREVFPNFHFWSDLGFQCFYHQSSGQTCNKVMWRYLPVTGVFIAKSIDETLAYNSVALPLLVIFWEEYEKILENSVKFKKKTCIYRKKPILTFRKNATATGHITAAAKMNPSYSPVGADLQSHLIHVFGSMGIHIRKS